MSTPDPTLAAAGPVRGAPACPTRWRTLASVATRIARLCLRAHRCLWLFAVLSFAPAAIAQARHALVIGNDNYRKVEPLRAAIADAELIAAELRLAGFEVKLVRDGDRRTMLREVVELARRTEAGGDAVIYFAGHGVQSGNTNYLLPVDFEGPDEAMLPFEGVSLNDLTSQLQDAKTRFSLLIVDACRNNPLAGRRGGRNLRVAPGLSPATPATGQMIVFSAGSGQVALDGLGPDDKTGHGVFAREFVRQMRVPGLDIREMMLTVREAVEELAASVSHAQRPAIYDESRGRFVFRPALPVPVPAPASGHAARAGESGARTGVKSAEQIEDELWATIFARATPEGYRAYLAEFPSGRYASAARVQLSLLGGAAGGSGGAASPAVPSPAVPSTSVPPVAAPAASPSGGRRESGGSADAVANASASAAAPATAKVPEGFAIGQRFEGEGGPYRLKVEVGAGQLIVESFELTSGLLRGQTIRCGGLRNRIAIDAQYRVNAYCADFRISGRFPRIDIFSSGRIGGGTIELKPIVPAGDTPSR